MLKVFWQNVLSELIHVFNDESVTIAIPTDYFFKVLILK